MEYVEGNWNCKKSQNVKSLGFSKEDMSFCKSERTQELSRDRLTSGSWCRMHLTRPYFTKLPFAVETSCAFHEEKLERFKVRETRKTCD